MLLKRSSLAIFMYLASMAASSPLELTGPSYGDTFEERAVVPRTPGSVPYLNSTNSSAIEPPHVLLAISDTIAAISAGFTGVLATSAGVRDIIDIANYIAKKEKAQSDNHSCGLISGHVDGVSYQYSATGRNCDTTAEVKTMSDAIERGINYMRNHRLNAICIKQDHKGTWRGFLQLAVGDAHIINRKCEVVAYNIGI